MENKNNKEIGESTPIHTQEVNETTKEFLIMLANDYIKFSNKNLTINDDPLHFLLRRLKEIKLILTHLELSWEKCIPIVHKGSILFHNAQEGKNAKQKMANLSTELINTMSFLAVNTPLIHTLILYYDNQINKLKTLIGETKESDSE